MDDVTLGDPYQQDGSTRVTASGAGNWTATLLEPSLARKTPEEVGSSDRNGVESLQVEGGSLLLPSRNALSNPVIQTL